MKNLGQRALNRSNWPQSCQGRSWHADLPVMTSCQATDRERLQSGLDLAGGWDVELSTR